MTTYSYPQTTMTFGLRDALAPGDINKGIKGTQFDPEFTALETAVNSKINTANPAFTGRMTGVTIDGGTY